MDLASAHYTNNTVIFLQQQGFIPKLHPQGCKPIYPLALLQTVEFWAHAQKGFLQWRMGGNFNPGIKAENQEGPANFRSADPLQHSHGAIGSLRLK